MNRETVLEKLNTLFPKLYKVVLPDALLDIYSEVEVVCDIHGIEKRKLRNVLLGKACTKCMKVKAKKALRKKNSKKFEGFVDTLEDYKIVSEYIDANTHILINHSVCDKDFKVTPGHFKDGNRCPYCRGRYKTTEDFKKEVYKLVGQEYEVIGEYLRSHSKVKVRHNLCGKEYEVAPNKFKQGRRCPHCHLKSSRLAKEIEHHLIDLNIRYEKEYSYKDCRNILPLPFDFAVFNNNSVVFLIEVDGVQHEKPVSKFGGLKGLEERLKRDGIKNRYCEDNGIPLVRLNKRTKTEGIEKIKTMSENLPYHTNLEILFNSQYDRQATISSRIRELYLKEGETLTSLKEKFNMSIHKLKVILDYLEFPLNDLEIKKEVYEKRKRRGSKKGISKYSKYRKEMIKMKQAGFSLRAVGVRFGTSNQTVKKIISLETD